MSVGKPRTSVSKRVKRPKPDVDLARKEAISSLGPDGLTIFRPSENGLRKAQKLSKRDQVGPRVPYSFNAAMEIALKKALGLPAEKQQTSENEKLCDKEGLGDSPQVFGASSRKKSDSGGILRPDKGLVREATGGRTAAPTPRKRKVTKPKPRTAKKAAKALERENAAQRKRQAQLDAKKKKAEKELLRKSQMREAVQDARRAFNASMQRDRTSAAAQASPFDDLLIRWKREFTNLRRLEELDPNAPNVASTRARLEAIEKEWERRRTLEPDHLEYFAWPTTGISGGVGDFGKVDWQPIGMLAYLGYHVGVNSDLKEGQRQKLLAHVYGMRLPPINDLTYMLAWDLPRSAKRLLKLADTLAALVRNAKRRQNTKLHAAISHWEADLAYLKKAFYDGRFDFRWPIL